MLNKLVAISVAAVAISAGAQPADTLEKVKRTGSITLGHRETSIPFSYVVGSDSPPVGYAIDLCLKVVDAVKTRLNMPNLKVAYQSVTSTNRIPLVQNGTIDLECGSTTNTMARQQQIAFSPNYFMANVSAAVKKSSNINSFTDLNGKTIATTAGTTSIPLLRAYERTKSANVTEIFGKDHADSFLLVQLDRAVAFVMDDILLAGLIATSTRPGDYKILNEALRAEPYAIGLRKDDPQFKGLVHSVFTDLMKSGQAAALYDKWFTKPIPPRNVNLNFPMSEATRDLYRNPTDKGI